MNRPLDPERLAVDRIGDPETVAPRHIRQAVWREVGRYVNRWVDHGGTALDLGAGRGDFVHFVDAKRKIAFDLSLDMLDEVPDGIEREAGDITDLSRFADNSIGTAMASNVLEHLEWPELERLAAELRRVLIPGGHMIVVNPNFRLKPREYFDNYTHRTIHTDRSMPGWFRSQGFDVTHVEGRFLPWTMNSRLKFGHKLVPLYLKLPYRPIAGQMLVVVRKPVAGR
jgi:ubiquinone/menaquinone biosynthesis C-methylase UbiE